MTNIRHRVTLRDIAQRTGYTVNTVSKALRDAGDLADDTKQLIKKTADEMGYIVNISANSLRSGHSHMLALIVADITNPVFAIIAKEIEAAARENDYTIIVMNTDEDETNEMKAVRSAIGKGVDGILFFQTMKSREPEELIERVGMPCVMLHRMYDDQICDAVLLDEERGGYLAGKRLIERGRKNMVMIAAPNYISSSRQRVQGFLRAMNEAGKRDSCRVLYLDSVLDDPSEKLREMFEAGDKPDGIFCFSDLMAFQTGKLLSEIGITAGNEVSLIGFDNIQSKLAIPYGLSTIAVHKTEMAQKALEIILKRISGDISDFPKHVVIPVELIERNSI